MTKLLSRCNLATKTRTFFFSEIQGMDINVELIGQLNLEDYETDFESKRSRLKRRIFLHKNVLLQNLMFMLIIAEGIPIVLRNAKCLRSHDR